MATRYPDGPGRDSWGFGTLATGAVVTVEQAIKEVIAHRQANKTWLSQHIKVPLLQHEWDAFESFYYQNGNKGNGKDTLGGRDAVITLINAGGRAWIAKMGEFAHNSKGEWKEGLDRRRTREKALAYDAAYGDIEKYGVYAGTPLTFVEWRPFPEEVTL